LLHATQACVDGHDSPSHRNFEQEMVEFRLDLASLDPVARPRVPLRTALSEQNRPRAAQHSPNNRSAGDAGPGSGSTAVAGPVETGTTSAGANLGAPTDDFIADQPELSHHRGAGYDFEHSLGSEHRPRTPDRGAFALRGASLRNT
jgi:hypothetical protein